MYRDLAAPLSRRRIERLALAATLLLPLSVLAIARSYTVNVGYYDDWVWAPMIIDMRHGTIPWASMWALHNNHRIFIPDLFALLIARFGPWSSVSETLFSVGLAAVTQLTWYATVARVVPPVRRIASFFLISLLIFSLAQSENWIWGFQIAWFIGNLGIAAMAYALTFRSNRLWSAAAVVFALVAAHSVAYGLDALLVGVAVASLEQPRSITKIAVWISATVLTWLSYAHDYAAGLAQAPSVTGIERAVQTLAYALAFLGSPVARPFGLAACGIIGLLGLIAYAWYAAAWARSRGAVDQHGRLVALALVIIPAFCALQIAYARLWEGASTALSGRYVTAASLFWIAMLVVVATSPRTVKYAKVVPAVFLLAVFAWVASQRAGFDDIRARSLDIYAAAQALPRYASAPEDEMRSLWPGEVFIPMLDAAEEGPFAKSVTSR